MRSGTPAPPGASEPLNFLEIGGGTGTAATCILDLQRRHPIRSRRATTRSSRGRRSRGGAAAAAVRELRRSSLGRRGDAPLSGRGQPPQPGAWHVLALEVLDNLAYDKLRIIPTDGGGGAPRGARGANRRPMGRALRAALRRAAAPHGIRPGSRFGRRRRCAGARAERAARPGPDRRRARGRAVTALKRRRKVALIGSRSVGPHAATDC